MPFLIPRSTPSAQLPAQPNVPEPADHHTASHTSNGIPVYGHLEESGRPDTFSDEDTEVRRSKCLLVDPDSPRHLPRVCGFNREHLSGHEWETDGPVWLTEMRRAELTAQETGALPVRTPGVVLETWSV